MPVGWKPLERIITGKKTIIQFDAFPRAYLRHETVVQKEAIEPALENFSDPAYATPADDFRTALDRHKTSDLRWLRDGLRCGCGRNHQGRCREEQMECEG